MEVLAGRLILHPSDMPQSRHFLRSPLQDQPFGVVHPPLATSLYSASLTCVPQAVP
jgi:hypothetical protein